MRSLGACRLDDFVYKVVPIHSGVEKLSDFLIYFQVRALNVRLIAFEVLQQLFLFSIWKIIRKSSLKVWQVLGAGKTCCGRASIDTHIGRLMSSDYAS